MDILYIVLAFCVLWLSAAFFWLIWQVATILRNINQTIAEAREKLALIEKALTAMKERFEKMTTVGSVVIEGVKQLIAYAATKKAVIAKKKK